MSRKPPSSNEAGLALFAFANIATGALEVLEDVYQGKELVDSAEKAYVRGKRRSRASRRALRRKT